MTLLRMMGHHHRVGHNNYTPGGGKKVLSSLLALLHVVSLLIVVVSLLQQGVGVVTAIPVTKQTTTFGNVIKNGPLPARTEVTTFEHFCSNPPCAITLIHIPSIYPPAGEAWNWTHGILNMYIDEDNNQHKSHSNNDINIDKNEQQFKSKSTKTTTQPTISITLLELAGESNFHRATTAKEKDDDDDNEDNEGSNSPPSWGIGMMGRTAYTGGVYSTVRIPFQTSIRTTIQAPSSSVGQSVYWFMIRGLENHGNIILGGGGGSGGHSLLELPHTARLRVARVVPTVLDTYEFLTLASSPNHTSGALLRVTLDASGPNFHYLEACLRLVVGGNHNHDTNVGSTGGTSSNFMDATPSTPPIFLSSGAEDYFLGASYFDAGMFQTPNSGLTYLDREKSTLGAYKTHTYDPIIFHGGMKLIFRNNELTNDCGTIDCCPRFFHNPSNSNRQNPGGNNSSSSSNHPFHHYTFNASQLALDLTRHSEKMQELHHQDNRKSTMSTGPTAIQSETKQPVVYSSLVWFYEWDSSDMEDATVTRSPSTASQYSQEVVSTSLSKIADLSASGLISKTEEDSAVDRMLDGDSKLVMLLEGFRGPHHQQQLVRQVRRYLKLYNPVT